MGEQRQVLSDFAPGDQDHLVTNEYAHWNSGAPDARTSRQWEMTSGSLFVRNKVAYSGRAERGEVDAASSKATNSAVFRLFTKQRTYDDVQFSLRFRMIGFARSGGPVDDWDGLHLWLRYRDQTQMYIASVARRDGTATLKRKDPGGSDNGGMYRLLTSTNAPLSMGEWHTALATIRTVRLGVEFTLDVDGRRVLETIDSGSSGEPLRAAGAVGIRADNLEFEFTDVGVADVT